MDLKARIRTIPDFPKPGINFIDITTLLGDGEAWRYCISQLAEIYRDAGVEVIVGPEARGFLVGAALAYELGVGFAPVRKQGKLPWKTRQSTYQLEYGQDTIEIHLDAVKPGQRVLVVDDLLATGGTVKAAMDLVRQLGGEVMGAAFLVELTFLGGRQALAPTEVHSLIQY
ncbi:MAG: adenine phosphoribosyltransferase [Bacillota bacterium]